MYVLRANAGQWIIHESEPGSLLFVVAEGELQVTREGKALGKIGPGEVFGELAVIYKIERQVYGRGQVGSDSEIIRARAHHFDHSGAGWGH